jgi:transcriptional regulator with XRE-family HTH domain
LTSFPVTLAGVEPGRKQVLIVEDWAEIRRLRKSEGVSISEIARLIGCSRNTVKAALASDEPPRYERARSGSLADGYDPRLAPTNPGPLPWIPGIPPTLHNHPVLGDYLAKRSQQVADLADQVQDHAYQGDAWPVWAASGSHPSTTLIGEIAVWRAANGINPQDPRPTGGGGQLETAPALWKQRLDRDIALSTDSSNKARSNERQSARTVRRRGHDDSQRPYKKPGQPPNRTAAPGR